MVEATGIVQKAVEEEEGASDQIPLLAARVPEQIACITPYTP